MTPPDPEHPTPAAPSLRTPGGERPITSAPGGGPTQTPDDGHTASPEVVSSVRTLGAGRGVTVEGVVAHARARAVGPLTLGGDAVVPAGMARLARDGEPEVALPVWPDGASPTLLSEYQVSPVTAERSGEARRVLAACLKCCWTDLAADPWPGVAAPIEAVLAAYRALIGRTDDLMRNWAVGALRRLHDSAWIVMTGGSIRLGPRCATWAPESHALLRELMARLPEPEEPVAAPLPTPSPAAPPPPTEAAVLTGEPYDEDVLGAFDERRRAELVAAFMAVEHAAEPVLEVRFAALRDPALRRALTEMLARRGRTLIQVRERWTSGYDDATAAAVGTTLGEAERAVLVLVLVHSVAIPRAEGLLGADTWLSPHPTPAEELRRHTQLPIGELEGALRTLRHAGLLSQVKAGEEVGGYIPGPQFHRLTAAARKRLQEELILAAGPGTPLAAAVLARRRPPGGGAKETTDGHEPQVRTTEDDR
ncbi:hypothetical protein [Spongiactinospora sp. TRM90649]|uniref:hypothetical protein n=1 Tax=Spongiactinospora sp. TRM90649 TaxID=3031114 RepID=UPI0023F6F9E1|nr:hypothetical protein [Spongiactinospora sp. TRM90649]MDF5752340.1 hypothetical protein [Spongiactinospora sp. TRM90649]